MTRMSDPNNALLVFGNTKTEIDKGLIEAFTQVCEELRVKRTDVVRQIIWEFVQEARKDQTPEGDH